PQLADGANLDALAQPAELCAEPGAQRLGVIPGGESAELDIVTCLVPGLAARFRARLGPARILLSGEDGLALHPRAARLGAAEAVRSRGAEVDDALAMEGAAAVDPHGGAAAVGEVRHAREARDGQRLVGGRHAVHVVDLAARGALAMELAAIPAREPAL